MRESNVSKNDRVSSEDSTVESPVQGKPIPTPGESLLKAAKEGSVDLIPKMLKDPALKKEELEAAINAAAEAGHPKVIAAFKEHLSSRISQDPMTTLTAPTSKPPKKPLFEEDPDLDTPYEALAKGIDAKMVQAEGIQVGKLVAAAREGKAELISDMLKADTFKKENLEAAIDAAAKAGHPKVIAAFKEHISAKASVDVLLGLNPTPMISNAEFKALSVGIDAKMKQAETVEKHPAFLEAVRTGNKSEFDKMLAEIPELATAKDKDGKTALHLAAEGGQKEILEELAKNKAALNVRDNSGRMPIHYAAEAGNREIFTMLENAGAMTGVTTTYGNKSAEDTLAEVEKTRKQSLLEKKQKTFLDAARNGPKETFNKMLQENPEFATAKDKDNKNALHFAAQHQNQEALEQILQHENVKNAINVLDKDGKTPLIYAAETGNKALYDTLVKAGADASIEHEGKKAEAILAEAAKRAEEERLKQEAAALKKDSSTPNIDPIDPALKAKMEGQAPKSAGSDSKDRPLSQEDFFAGRVEKLPYQPGEPCKNGEDKFKFDPQTKTSTRAMSDPTKSHVMETVNTDGSFKYDIKTVAPDDSPTKIHKIEGDFGTLYFDAKGAMIGAELSQDPEKLKKLDPAQRAQAEEIMQEKLVREEQSRSSGAQASSIDTAEATKSKTLGADGKPIVVEAPIPDGQSPQRPLSPDVVKPIRTGDRASTERDSSRDSEGPIFKLEKMDQQGSEVSRDSASEVRRSSSMRDSLSSRAGSATLIPLNKTQESALRR